MRLRAVLKSRKMLASATAILGVSVLLLTGGTTAFAQAAASDPHAKHASTDPADQNRQLADQIAELRVQVARLQAAVQQTGRGKKVNPNSGMRMSPAPAKGMAAMSPGGKAPMSPGMSTQAPADPMRQPAVADAAGQDNQQLMNEVAELRAQVAKLQAAVQQSGPAQKSSANSGMPTGTAGKSGGMGAMGGMAPPGKAANALRR